MAPPSYGPDVVSTGFAEFGPLSENLFVPLATLPGSMNFLARVRRHPSWRRMGSIIGDGGNCGLVRQQHGSGASRPRRADCADQPAALGGCPSGCEYAVVSTWPGSGSQRNMERRGFRVAYTKLVMVRRWPETEVCTGTDDGH